MSFRVRSSKFRHVYGQALKREQCYDNIRVTKSSWNSTFCAVNPKFLAIIVESTVGGAFIVLPHNKVGRIATDHPLVDGHKGPVLDIAWCPHNDNVIASGSDDCVVKVWDIPDSGLDKTLTEPIVSLVYHQRKVGLVLWHPTAFNVLLTAGSDKQVVLWNVDTGEALVEIVCHPDIVYSASFNWDGSKLLTTCKDKKIRILNPRTGEVESDAIAHEGNKATRAIFLRDGRVFTTGFSKKLERQYSLRLSDHLDVPIALVELDKSNGVMFPLYDPDANLVYLCGKGDSMIRYFEITPGPPFVHHIDTFRAPDPQRGIGMMPKRGCDVTSCEISRFYRLNNSGLCQVITMTVPRTSNFFQEDLYPDTLGDTPALMADDWIGGQDAEPILISLKDGYHPAKSKSSFSVTKRRHKTIPAREDTGDEVEIVSETKVTPDEEKEALRLGLPPKFLSYKQLPDCTCEQCKKDDEYLKELFTTSEPQLCESLFNFGTPSSYHTTPSTGGSIFGTPTGTIFNFTPQSQGKSETLRSLLLKPPHLTSPSAITIATTEIRKTEDNSSIPLSFLSATTQALSSSSTIFSQTPAIAGNIFGGSNNELLSGPGTRIFGNNSSAPSSGLINNPTPTTNIFGNSSSSSIFSSSSSASTPTNIFSTGTSSKTSNFSSIPSSTTSLFGSTASTPIFGSTKDASIFGCTPFSTSSTSIPVSTTKPASPSNTNIIKTAPSLSNDVIVEQSTYSTAAIPNIQITDITATQNENIGGKSSEEDVILFKTTSNISFADLAATTVDAKPAFSKTGTS